MRFSDAYFSSAAAECPIICATISSYLMARCSLWGNRFYQWRRAQLSAKQLVCSSSSSVVDPLGLPLEGGGSQGMECEEWKPSVLPISRLTTRDRKKRRHRCPRSVTFSTFSFAVRVQVRVRLQVRILYWTCTNAWIERSVGKQTCAIQVNRAGYFVLTNWGCWPISVSHPLQDQGALTESL